MIKKALLLTTLMMGLSTAYASDLSCGQKESEFDKTKKTFLGEAMKSKPSFIEMTKANQKSNQSAKSEKKTEKPCDEHCADKEHCEEYGHACDESCGEHKDHDHKH